MTDYKLEGAKWADQTVTWSMADTNFAGRGFQFASFAPHDAEADIQAAFDRWQSVSALTFKQVADSSASDIRLGMNPIDGLNNIVGETNYAMSRGSAGGLATIQWADIEFDSDEAWSIHAGHEESAGHATLYEVALHEIGHALGLDHYTDGPAIMNPVISVSDITGSDIDGIQALYGAHAPGAAGQVAITGTGQTVTASDHDVFENNNQANTTFIFGAGYGHDVINGFKVAGKDHDLLSLLSADFHSVQDVLRHTTNTSAGAVIHDAVSGDSIQVSDISKMALAHHRADIIFHT